MGAIAETSIRAVVFFVWLVILVRLMGKRQIRELTLFDYVGGIALGNIAGSTIVHLTASTWAGLAAVGIWAGLTLALAWGTRTSRSFGRLVNGEPMTASIAVKWSRTISARSG